jgi:DNA-binding NtrC family response regulator
MIKRVVILQDEQLVIREMSLSPRGAVAYASAGIGPRTTPLPSEDEEPETAESSMEDEPVEEDADSAVSSGKLADIAKAAAMKAERAVIEDTLRQLHWNRRRAAEQLGVSYKTLLNKIKECGISHR